MRLLAKDPAPSHARRKAAPDRPPDEKAIKESIYKILFLCTGNSARSILAERLVERWGQGRFLGFGAGSHPQGEVHPLAFEILRRNNCRIDGLRSKDWAEFTEPGAPQMDFVFTVCDKAAAEVCPAWPGQPMTAHWGVADPATEEGDEVARMAAFRTACRELQDRITNHLSAISADWAQGPGVGKLIDWPAGAMVARGNQGVANV